MAAREQEGRLASSLWYLDSSFYPDIRANTLYLRAKMTIWIPVISNIPSELAGESRRIHQSTTSETLHVYWQNVNPTVLDRIPRSVRCKSKSNGWDQKCEHALLREVRCKLTWSPLICGAMVSCYSDGDVQSQSICFEEKWKRSIFLVVLFLMHLDQLQKQILKYFLYPIDYQFWLLINEWHGMYFLNFNMMTTGPFW